MPVLRGFPEAPHWEYGKNEIFASSVYFINYHWNRNSCLYITPGVLMLIDLIQKRQSTRIYSATAVQRQLIQQCVTAARFAPSACNSQPWHFIIVDEPELKNRLCEEIFSGVYSLNIFAKEAPAIIVVVSEKNTFLASAAGFFRNVAYYLIDIGTAINHFILQAQELGLSTCWIGWFNEKKAKEIMGIPQVEKVVCIISLGYSNEPQRKKSRKPLEEICSFNSYKNSIK